MSALACCAICASTRTARRHQSVSLLVEANVRGAKNLKDATSIPGDANAYRICARQTQPLHLPRNETTKARARCTANRSIRPIENTFLRRSHRPWSGEQGDSGRKFCVIGLHPSQSFACIKQTNVKWLKVNVLSRLLRSVADRLDRFGKTYPGTRATRGLP
jgi:hypothetical protein